MSFQYSELFVPPRMTFIGVRSEVYPYYVKHQYFPPTEFRRRMDAALAIERDRIAMARAKLMELVRQFQDTGIDWNDEYEREDSKRWRAWYDLTKGRLLSTLTRYDEYLATAKTAASSLDSSTNAVLFLPTETTRMASSGEMIEEARIYLKRCIDQNQSTPWESLARWELEQPWGIRIESEVVPPPTMQVLSQGIRGEAQQSFVFPKL